MSAALLDGLDVLEAARTSTAATFTARLAAGSAIRHHDESPSAYRAGVAAEMVGLYGWLLAAEADAWGAWAKRALQ